MDINYELVENVLKTLPVSFYTGREISVSLSKTSQNTFYNLKADTITISYPCIEKAFSRVQGLKELESHIRALLYHEISHAILTPSILCEHTKDALKHTVNNIFEDERIETVLKDFYYGVNFKRNIVILSGYKGEKPKNFMEAFFNDVRFRQDPKFNSRISQLIKKYEDMNGAETNGKRDYYISSAIRSKVANYVQDVMQLFYDITKDWAQENDEDKLDELAKELTGNDYSSASEPQRDKIIQRYLADKADEIGDMLDKMATTAPNPEQFRTTKKIQNVYGQGRGSTDEENSYSGTRDLTEEEEEGLGEDVLSEEEIEKLIEEAINAQEEVREIKKQKLIDSTFNQLFDPEMIDGFKMIIENFLARNKNNNGAIQRYSGRLDPRAVGRDDWRIFQYKSQNGPVKGFDKLHLNLFIDTSGSYSSNEEQTNKIIKALEILEKQYSFFDFDLITCQVGEQIRPKNQRYIEAYGGNDLDDEIHGIYKKVQVPTALNYNVILFDGDAFTDCWGRDHRKNFSAFNNSKCTIISDIDNKRYIEQYAPLAHTILVGSEYGQRNQYSSLLFENITNALTRALL